MRSGFETWLRQRGCDERYIGNQLSYIRRVENHYGDLDDLFGSEGLDDLIDALRYSTDDERQHNPNPSLIPFQGDIRTNLASYRGAVARYRDYSLKDGANDPTQDRCARPLTRPHVPDRHEGKPATLLDFRSDGLAALEAVIAQSEYGTVDQAIASLTLFSHPATVAQTGAKGVFPTIRGQKRVGQRDLVGSRMLMFDDNKSPTYAFLWANRMTRRGRDTQFNHVYAASDDPDAYTSLANICMTPAFLAKLTDTSLLVRDLLCFRAFDLYRWKPDKYDAPEKPARYDGLAWVPPLPETASLADVLRAAMARKPKDRTVIAARELGWLFGTAQ